jgi:hypothetical protein
MIRDQQAMTSIDWIWRPVPELRDLPPVERRRLLLQCSSQAMRSRQFVITMALTQLVNGLVFLAIVWGGLALRLQTVQAVALGVIGAPLCLAFYFLAFNLTIQPWMKETRRLIRQEQAQINGV